MASVKSHLKILSCWGQWAEKLVFVLLVGSWPCRWFAFVASMKSSETA